MKRFFLFLMALCIFAAPINLQAVNPALKRLDKWSDNGQFLQPLNERGVGGNGQFYTTAKKIPASYGEDVAVDGGLENWDDNLTPNSWRVLSFGGSVERESTKIHSGVYSAKFTEGAEGGNSVLVQRFTDLTPGTSYVVDYWALSDSSESTSGVSVMWLNGTEVTAEYQWNFVAQQWMTWTGQPCEDCSFKRDHSDVWSHTDVLPVTVPPSGELFLAIDAAGSPLSVGYIDDIRVRQYFPENYVTLFDFVAPETDGGDVGGLDYVFRYRDKNGALLYGMLANGEYATASGQFDFSAEPVKISQIVGNPKLGQLNHETFNDLLADNAVIDLPVSSGWGEVFFGNNASNVGYAKFSWTDSGELSFLFNTTNVEDADVDEFLCIYDAGTHVAIKNRLGSAIVVKYFINY